VLEFTGERVIPGEVQPDLWNEHLSRYQFAAQFAASRVVADLGCGAGYGSALLARHAAAVHGFDLSPEAIRWAADRYQAPNLHFAVAGCGAVPLDRQSAGLVVAFELIEHLENPEALLAEARRILAPDGLFCVSTPNAAYYAESRGAAGPNPFHAREYTLAEFHALLARHFPAIALFAQDHTPAISFRSLAHAAAAAAYVAETSSQPANFFVAVCALGELPEIAPFVYVPAAGNILREREQHIARLEGELAQKQTWLDRAITEHAALVDAHRRLHQDLEQANAWAKARDAEFAEKSAHVEQLSAQIRELEEEKTKLSNWARGLEADLTQRTEWALRLDAELAAKSADLLRALEILHAAEAERDERTRWALSLDAHRQALEARIAAAQASRWLRLGRFLGLGPKLLP
jgi:2-polyprenyl-3-methyl-5-hydroxy-6-metoxy-1,4-benzoquinol methylase